MAAAVAETGIRGHGPSMAYFTLYSQRMGTCRRLLGFLGVLRPESDRQAALYDGQHTHLSAAEGDQALRLGVHAMA